MQQFQGTIDISACIGDRTAQLVNTPNTEDALRHFLTVKHYIRKFFYPKYIVTSVMFSTYKYRCG